MEPATGRPDADAAEFLEFLERCHDALRQHTGGNPRPYLELWSHADDVSLMGGSAVTRSVLARCASS